MKEKPDWLYIQSAVVPFIVLNGELNVVLVTSSKSKKWIVPKGTKELDLSLQDSAAKEALEEAGVLGEVEEEPIGYHEYKKWNGTCKVHVYALRVSEILDDWPEANRRVRKIVPVNEALELVKNEDISGIIMNYISNNTHA